MPNLSGLTPLRYERYYLKSDGQTVERVQKKGDKYEFEIKRSVTGLEHIKEKKQITQDEFEKLKQGKEKDVIIRDGYQLSVEPNVSIKVYRGKYEGLIRAEVEFNTKEVAENYVAESWMGVEITTSALGSDAKLLRFSREEFLGLL